MKTIGIIGGMGPEATAQFYLEMVRIFQRRFGAKYDDNYPETIIYNLPLPDVVEGKGDESKIILMLSATAKKLESVGADFLTIPCNTACRYLQYIEKQVSIPILNIIVETVKKVQSESYSKIGLLATKSTAESGMYSECFEKYGIKVILPTGEMQEEITGIIMEILGGKKGMKDRNRLNEIVKYLAKKGAEAIVLGCTDLPLLLKKCDREIILFDTLKILAEATVLYSIGNDINNINQK
jgi:aspartate racemase